jgi:lycopene elongase/hydratase (dihydrobisanhydrobacterioruberin-forming)
MNTVLRIIKTSRPLFWFYTAGPYIVGLSILYKMSGIHLQLLHVLFLLFFLFPANFFIYSINDYFDQDTDKYNPKKNNVENKYQARDRYINLIIQLIICIYALLLLFILPTIQEKIVFLLFITLSFFYSAPPIFFKRRPFLDSLSNSFYFLPGILAIYQSSTTHIPTPIIIALVAWTAAMHLFSAIPDIAYDKKVKLHTTATYLGRPKSLLLCFLFWFIFSVICIYYEKKLVLFFIYPVIPLVLLFSKNTSIIRIYWYFPYINIMLGFLFFLYICFYL